MVLTRANVRPFPLVVLLSLPAAASLSAQSVVPRPNAAVFEGAAVNPSKHDALYMTLSASADHDDSAATTSLSNAGTPKQAGALTTLGPRLVYGWGGKHLRVDASAGSALRYSSTSQSFAGNTHYGGFGVSGGTKRTRVSFGHSLSYSPAYLFGLLPPASSGVNDAAAAGQSGLSGQRALSADSELRVEQSLSRRARISALGGYWTQGLTNGVPHSTTRGYTAGGRFLFDLARDATLHAGYVHREGDASSLPAGRKTIVHDVDLGIDYHRALSLSRRTHASFGVASSMVNTPRAPAASTQTLIYRLGGTATLSHDMRRTWRLQADYRRGVEILPAVAGPVFADGITISLGGFFTRRSDFESSAGYTRGSVGATSGASNRLQTYAATARVRHALGRRWALFGEYLHYGYGVGANVAVVGTMAPALDRNSARAGVTLWFPLMRK